MSNIILLINNDPKEGDLLKRHFPRAKYVLHEVSWHAASPMNIKAEKPDMVVFNLPGTGVNETELCEWLRAWAHVPMIVLSHANTAYMEVAALNAGADDFISKPYRIEELLARVQALLRRTGKANGQAHQQAIEINGLTIDLNGRRAFVDGKDIRLTKTEFSIVAELAQHLDKVCAHDELLSRVWGWEYWGANHYLYVYLGRIRKKIGERYNPVLQTIPGIGYILHSAIPN
jgi:two-component system KDP operon response regulator KdpE